ncbi:hypothetical protein [Actinokineospora alba]|uniref:hypothetical protein n=1 Tax=Actinokineospora alba TaxID=504798 RepID=UPI00105E329C|nr:hypothetical protein [Actinokineospora alba]
MVKPVVQACPADSLKARDFSGSSMSFRRIVDDIEQKVNFGLFVHPKYARNSAHLILGVEVFAKGIVDTYKEMLPSDPNPKDSCRIFMPLESLSRERVSPWLFHDMATVKAMESKIVRTIEGSVIPFLDEAASTGGLLEICREGINKAASVLGYSAGNRAVIGAALAVSMGDVPGGLDLIRVSYSNSPSLRREYDTAFLFLERLNSR